MDRREVIISDFRKWAREKERLAEECTPDKWELVDYQTAVAGGTMLMASEETLPQPVTVDPGLAGWHRVYVCQQLQPQPCREAYRDDETTRLQSVEAQQGALPRTSLSVQPRYICHTRDRPPALPRRRGDQS